MKTDWLTNRTQATPQRTAILIGKQQWTYAELDHMVNSVCCRLQAAGVEPGDFVGVLMPNCLGYVCLIHALARLGATLVPLNTRLTEAELAWQVEHVGCKFVLCQEKDERLRVHSQQLTVNHRWLTSHTPGPVHHFPFSSHQLQTVVFTSGTSGNPKGVPLTFNHHLASAMASAYRLGVAPNDVWLSCLPLYHVGGLAVIWRSCLYGTAVNLHPRFILEEVNHALDTLPITLISLVPTMLYRLLETRSHWPAALRLILLGGAAAPEDLVSRANGLERSEWSSVNEPLSVGNSKPLVATTYGLTEASSQVATMLPEEVTKKPGSVGKPLLFTSVAIVNENGRSLPPNQYGEIVITGPTVMANYFEKDQRLKKKDLHPPHQPSTFNRQSSFATGDIGYLDDDSNLWIVQRRSDLIVSGGENVYPAEVEAVLKAHPAVANACVVGLPDAEWGQVVAAMVQVAPTHTLSPEELLAYSREHLAGYKQPRQLKFVTELPQTASGKIARNTIVDQLSFA
ncbi:MAG: o-succinylbenzoate--CoA ligase [Chloroflexi bacterium]|nr:MAG: o-succinylbenzoate--CoA ligase [Chloroflexota bacterium]